MSETGRQPSLAEIYAQIAALPQVQAGHVTQQTIDRWVGSVMRTDPTRIFWHIARAAGIGGSDMGSVMEVPHAYSTAAEVYAQKMLTLPPYRATPAMLRGAVMEDPIRELFEGPEDGPINLAADEQRKERLAPLITSTFEAEINRLNPGVRCVPRPDLEALFKQPFDPAAGAPEWLTGNTDRIYQIGEYINITDFKAPSTETLKKMIKDPSYFAKWDVQVQAYGLNARYRGFEPSSLDLAIFDYQNYGSRPFYVRAAEPSNAVFQNILDGGDFFWHDCVMQGREPGSRTSVQVLNPVPVPEIVERAAARALHFAAMESAAKELADTSKEAVLSWLNLNREAEGMQLSMIDGDASTGLWKTSLDKDFHAEAALNRLVDLGLIEDTERDAFREPPKPMSVKDPAFPGKLADGIKALRETIDDLRLGVEPVAPAAIAEMLEPLLAGLTPMAKGELNVELIRDSVILAGQPLQPFETTSPTLRRNTKKKAVEVFANIKDSARDSILEYVDEMVEPELEQPEQQLEGPDEDMPVGLVGLPGTLPDGSRLITDEPQIAGSLSDPTLPDVPGNGFTTTDNTLKTIDAAGPAI